MSENYLTWSDEFSGSLGTLPDSSKWNFVLGNHLSGDGQIQQLTDKNAYVDGRGNLVIEATEVDGKYYSSYLTTQGKFSQKYGVFSARIKCAGGIGLWSAFWMVGNNGSWPQRGEIDVVEQIGNLQQSDNLPQSDIAHGSIVLPSTATGSKEHFDINTPYKLPTPDDDYFKDFHIFAVEWRKELIKLSIDGIMYKALTPADVPNGYSWPFDAQSFFIRLSLAVGGNWPGNPPVATVFPTSMIVDWVRVYR